MSAEESYAVRGRRESIEVSSVVDVLCCDDVYSLRDPSVSVQVIVLCIQSYV